MSNSRFADRRRERGRAARERRSRERVLHCRELAFRLVSGYANEAGFEPGAAEERLVRAFADELIRRTRCS